MIAPSPPGAQAAPDHSNTWATINYNVDGPSLEFVHPPFNLNIPLTDEELRGMAAGTFPEQVEAALGSATLPPARPLTADDWAALSRIARDALDATAPVVPIQAGAPADELDDADAIGGSTPAGTPPPGDAQADREFKVILEFAERGAGPRQVVISVGGASRSETFRCCAVGDWRDALVIEAPRAIEAFIERCREQPVYPTYRPATPAQATTQPKTVNGVAQAKSGRRGKNATTVSPPLTSFTPQAEADPTAVERPARTEPATVTSPRDASPMLSPEPIEPVRKQLSFLFG